MCGTFYLNGTKKQQLWYYYNNWNFTKKVFCSDLNTIDYGRVSMKSFLSQVKIVGRTLPRFAVRRICERPKFLLRSE